MARYRLGLVGASRRWRLLILVAVVALCVGVPAAYAALDTTDTATGTGALLFENGGYGNTADGYYALSSNTTGATNTAVGTQALSLSTTTGGNTAVGYWAMVNAIGSDSSTAVGTQALYQTSGCCNSALGNSALFYNSTGANNTAVGSGALYSNGSGNENTAVGNNAGYSFHSNITGSNNTFLGHNASTGTDTELNNATAIGANATVSQSNSLVLGASGVNVGVNTTTPKSSIQLGNGATSEWDDYLQLPIVQSTDKTPPTGDCNNTSYVGRVIVQANGKKHTIWLCTLQGVWKKV